VSHLGSVVAAYIVAWAVLLGYEFTLARRMSRLRQDLDRLKNIAGRSEAPGVRREPASAGKGSLP
jgi:CcmD family protein